MALKDKLHSIKMKSDEGVASCLTCVTQVKDELAAVGETIPDSELVRIALKGFTMKWEIFVKCIVGKEMLPSWSRLWDDFTQEEIQYGSQVDQTSEDVEHNVALTTKSKNKKKKYIS